MNAHVDPSVAATAYSWGPLLEPFGPVYNVTGVDKWRKLANKGLMTVDQLFDYGDAVCEAVRRAQRQAMAREATPVSNKCYASGTAHNSGEAILKALRAQQRTAFRSGPPSDPRTMTRVPGDWFLNPRGEMCRA